ncbi:16S rRNA (uracil(1498)-N(3))-methyltransferase [Porphyromonadaceae bacterium OttesenSCG-928-L07]|nr:16S rRNA (uracil(1498)-N(3))-methyltransferase [Porphyromonadaceae bacterium OttesenSCG-928-L07]MDL2252253.1 16S rRNA (uracil(1498)-N(3))-methyltransferase [Odoribacter sp. OttesenSCG-928-J03]MDL2330808.1 16S rRNA (uracil(1498)-N(3))-methyltransferase [Odoribacter sp. OttesenSCG-928-A06]
MHIFYTPDISGNHYALSPEESKHCTKVLRLQAGDVIALVDGKGGFYKGEITQTGQKACEVKIIEAETEYGQWPFYLHMAVAPTKNIDRTEWMLEKCTEIGVNEVSMLNTDHSERKVVKADRLEKVMVSAMKQSLKAYLPKLNDMTDVKSFIRSCKESQKFIAHCHEGDKKRLDEVYREGSDAVILIGPEGDFSEEEVKIAMENGFIPVTLGKSRLRTETAGVVACHSINFLNRR